MKYLRYYKTWVLMEPKLNQDNRDLSFCDASHATLENGPQLSGRVSAFQEGLDALDDPYCVHAPYNTINTPESTKNSTQWLLRTETLNTERSYLTSVTNILDEPTHSEPTVSVNRPRDQGIPTASTILTRFNIANENSQRRLHEILDTHLESKQCDTAGRARLHVATEVVCELISLNDEYSSSETTSTTRHASELRHAQFFAAQIWAYLPHAETCCADCTALQHHQSDGCTHFFSQTY